MNRGRIISKVIVLFLFLLVAGCSGAKETSTSKTSIPTISKGEKLVITASSFQFDPAEVKIPANVDVEVQLNMGESLHGLAIPDLNVDIKEHGESVQINAKPGTYEYVCSIMCGAGHEEMKGLLVVE